MHENYTIRMKGIYYFVEGNLMSEKYFKTFSSLFQLIINKNSMMHSPRNNLNSRYISSQFNWPPDRCSCHKKLVWVQVFDKPIQFNDWVSRPTHIFLRRLCLFTYAERSQSLRWANVLDEFSEIFNLLATLDFQASIINLQKVKSTRFQTVSKVIASKWSKDFHIVRVKHLFVCTSLRYTTGFQSQ